MNRDLTNGVDILPDNEAQEWLIKSLNILSEQVDELRKRVEICETYSGVMHRLSSVIGALALEINRLANVAKEGSDEKSIQEEAAD